MRGVAVLSGKGGVGKSLIAINLANQLASDTRVALVDADISNPSILQLLGVFEEHEFEAEDRIRPITVKLPKGEVEVFSIDGIVRGRGVYKIGYEYAKILGEVLKNASWTADTFIIDAPAGLGDVHKMTVSAFGDYYAGSIVVGIPAHSAEVLRVLEVHQVNGIPVLGVIENMVGFKCPKCGASYQIFGEPVIKRVAEEFGVPFFGSIPLDYRIRENLPWIPDDLIEPVAKAAEAVKSAEPRPPGFLKEIKEFVTDKVSEALIKVLPRLLVLINRTVPIEDIRKSHGLPGGRIIRLNLMGPDMVRVIQTYHFVVKDGVLKLVDKPGIKPYASIDIYYRALAWALLGKKPDGTPYDFFTAFWNDQIRVSSAEGAENVRAWYFLQHVLEHLKKYASGDLEQLLGVIA